MVVVSVVEGVAREGLGAPTNIDQVLQVALVRRFKSHHMELLLCHSATKHANTQIHSIWQPVFVCE